MINSVKAFVVVIILALTTSYSSAQTPKVVVIPLGGYDGPVCCKVNSDGSLIVEESHRLCNADSSRTRWVANGEYWIDFLSPLTDVRSKVKMLTLDTQSSGAPKRNMGGVADRFLVTSSVCVSITSADGNPANEGYNICLF